MGVGTLVERIAEELKWSEAEVRSFSLPAIRDLLPEGSKLRAEVTGMIRTGEHIARVTKTRGRK